MNSIQRIRAAVSFEKPDRVPVIPQVFGHAAVAAGSTIRDYVQSGKSLAHCQIMALERYGYDAVFAVMDVNVETEALGSELVYRHDDYPFVASYAFSEDTNLQAVSMPNPSRDGRMPEILHALRTLRRELGEEVLVVGSILGPMTLTSQLLGMESALYLVIDDPEGFERVLDFSTRVLIQFGIAQIESGAHLCLIFDPSASPAVIPAQVFREFERPRLKQIFDALNAAGALGGWLHIAGPITSILPSYSGTGANIINFDYCVAPQDVINGLPSICCNGNIKSFDFEDASEEKVLSDSLKLQDLFAGRGGFILSSGCEIPPRSRPENIDALVSAVRLWR